MTMPLFVLIAVGFDAVIKQFKHQTLAYILVFVLLMPSLYADFFILFRPLYAPIPQADKGQYLNDWPSGWGTREITSIILTQSQKGKVTVITDGTFGLLPYAFEIYLVDKPNIEIQGIWPLPKIITHDLIQKAQDHTTYLIINQSEEPPQKWPLQLLQSYTKGLRTDRSMKLYLIVPPKDPERLQNIFL